MQCTLNNPTILLSSLWNEDKMIYLCGQKERGQNGTEHFQFMIRFHQPQTSAALKKSIIACILKLQ